MAPASYVHEFPIFKPPFYDLTVCSLPDVILKLLLIHIYIFAHANMSDMCEQLTIVVIIIIILVFCMLF